MISLPEVFTERMQKMLGEEYPAFLASYAQQRRYGLRLNTLKISPEAFLGITDFRLSEIPWIPAAWYYRKEDEAARHPFYYGGLYYLQEPSAMTPAAVLDIAPGDRVLDLCAAPGGKSTALGAKLKGRGVLVANDISASRCKALLKNLEVFGIANAVVTNASPERLSERFPEYFDAVLVDAPCSGEGMFRKDDTTITAWYPEKPHDCAVMQRQIVSQAVKMLRPGGKMLYSTCTFSLEENEQTVQFILDAFPEMQLCPVAMQEGFSGGIGSGMEKCVRLWPHKTGGEGHFLALFRKTGGLERADIRPEHTGSCENRRVIATAADLIAAFPGKLQERGTVKAAAMKKDKRYRRAKGDTRTSYVTEDGREMGSRRKKERYNTGESQSDVTAAEKLSAVGAFIERTALKLPEGRAVLQGDSVYLWPEEITPQMLAGITYLRCGLLIGQFVSGRFEPSQAMAMAADTGMAKNIIRLQEKDERLLHYLKGETIQVSDEELPEAGGWVLIAAGRYALGWGKLSGNVVKNKYLSGWRMKY